MMKQIMSRPLIQDSYDDWIRKTITNTDLFSLQRIQANRNMGNRMSVLVIVLRSAWLKKNTRLINVLEYGIA
jgi:hypothetical protein